MAVVETEKPRDPLASLKISRREVRRQPSLVWRFTKILLILAVLAGLGFGGFVASQKFGLIGANADWIPDALKDKPELSYGKVTVETGRAADATVVATGYIESFRQANIGARAAGRIETVFVEEGSPVKAGEVIAVLDHKDIDAALAATRASLMQSEAQLSEQEVEIARSKKELDRISKLRQSSVSTEAEFDRVTFAHQAAVAKRATMEAAVKLQQARVQESEQFRENMIVRAPFDGTVISKDAEVGESILPGGMGEASGRGSVVTIADLARLEVECDVKEGYISRVTTGSPAEVAVDAVPDKKYSARVRKVIPMGDRARATIKVKVEILDADEKLFPEMSATVHFLPEPGEKPVESNTRRVFCDSDAIFNVGDNSYVWTVADDFRIKKIRVEPGRVRDQKTEVVEGLTGGERVLLRPTPNLEDGQLVKLRE
jgi:RND family efflux transporter MFP subunit